MLIRLFIICSFVFSLGCSSQSVKEEEQYGLHGPTQEVLEDGTILERFDVNQDGEPDVWKYVIETQKKEDPSVTSLRLIKKEIDVNFDGSKNITRHYNEDQQLKLEEIDIDFDGKIDVVNHFDNGILAKKDLFEGKKEKTTTRYYGDKGALMRVEKDTNGDQKIDYWEYYESGVLDRIGRDLNNDGRADTWQTR